MRQWMADVPSDTPPLTVRSAYALTRLFHLERYSAENTVVLASCVRTAKLRGWERVCDLVGVPVDASQWPTYRFRGRDAVSTHFEDAFDQLAGPYSDTDEWIARLNNAYAQQCLAFAEFDLERVIAASGVT